MCRIRLHPAQIPRRILYRAKLCYATSYPLRAPPRAPPPLLSLGRVLYFLFGAGVPKKARVPRALRAPVDSGSRCTCTRSRFVWACARRGTSQAEWEQSNAGVVNVTKVDKPQKVYFGLKRLAVETPGAADTYNNEIHQEIKYNDCQKPTMFADGTTKPLIADFTAEICHDCSDAVDDIEASVYFLTFFQSKWRASGAWRGDCARRWDRRDAARIAARCRCSANPGSEPRAPSPEPPPLALTTLCYATLPVQSLRSSATSCACPNR